MIQEEIFDLDKKIKQITGILDRRKEKASEWNPNYKKILQVTISMNSGKAWQECISLKKMSYKIRLGTKKIDAWWIGKVVSIKTVCLVKSENPYLL